jgi:hypothetical protein
MSRSRRKRPYISLFGHRSEKEWKQINNRALRRKVKQQLKEDEVQPLPTKLEHVMDPFDYPSDGTKVWRKNGWWTPEKLSKYMRK